MSVSRRVSISLSTSASCFDSISFLVERVNTFFSVSCNELLRVFFLSETLCFRSSIMKSDLDNSSSTCFLPEGVLFENLCGRPCPRIITLLIKELVKSGRRCLRIASLSRIPLPEMSCPSTDMYKELFSLLWSLLRCIT